MGISIYLPYCQHIRDDKTTTRGRDKNFMLLNKKFIVNAASITFEALSGEFFFAFPSSTPLED